MRLTLIIPPSGFLLDAKVFPVLGILRVASAARATGHDVDVWDFSAMQDMRFATATALIGSDDCDAYGITATMPQMPAAAEIARTLRAFRPRSRLLLGGPHVTLAHDSCRRSERAAPIMRELAELFDVLVCGDGEKALGEALACRSGSIVDADDAKSSLFMSNADLEASPYPARDLIDIRSYRYAIDGAATMSLIAQLGCPFGCAFCGGRRAPSLRRIRTRSTEHVVGEMRHLFQAYGTTGFMFLDDELNVNRSFLELLEGIYQLQEEVGREFRLRGLLKSELVTDQMAAAMARAGFRQVLVGFESGAPRILENIQKRATVDDNSRCVDTLRRHGISVKALMSLGHPGETPETAEASERWLLEAQPTDFDVTIITTYPGTPYFDDAAINGAGDWTYSAKNGDRLHQVPVNHLHDVNFYKGRPGDYQSFVYTDAMSREELCARRNAMEQSVRDRLHIAWPSSPAELLYEHSMAAR